MKEALAAWLAAAARGGDAVEAARASAEAVAADPWAAVEQAGRLARCRLAVAPHDLALGAPLNPLPADSRRALVRVPQGAPYPRADRGGRRRRGAWDTPRAMARRLVAQGLELAPHARTMVDPACGPGAFLVAATERGLVAHGGDLDAAALAVARVACPEARLERSDAFAGGTPADLVAGNPPFVSPEHQDRDLRRRLRERYPWLEGRFDLAVPFAAAAEERVAPGGALALVLPWSVLVERYGRPLRRRWLAGARLGGLPVRESFPGASVHVGLLALAPGAEPGPLAPHGLDPADLLALPQAPLDRALRPGDAALARRAREHAVPLGEICVVDTGVVAHGPDGGKARLLRAEAGEGTVPFADARQFFAGQHVHLSWEPERMHRPKSLALFEGTKLLVQRLRGRGPVRAAVDRSGIVPGHTLLVIKPRDERVRAHALVGLPRDPLTAGLLRLDGGQRLDLYPRDVAGLPVPRSWLEGGQLPLGEALGLTDGEVKRLQALAPGGGGA